MNRSAKVEDALPRLRRAVRLFDSLRGTGVQTSVMRRAQQDVVKIAFELGRIDEEGLPGAETLGGR